MYGCCFKVYKLTGSSKGFKQSSNTYIELLHHWAHWAHFLSQPRLALRMTRCECRLAIWLGHLRCVTLRANYDQSQYSGMEQVICNNIGQHSKLPPLITWQRLLQSYRLEVTAALVLNLWHLGAHVLFLPLLYSH